jgi:ribosomal protein L24
LVCAKFQVLGDTSNWLRIRLQEEIFAHGIEGNVLQADPRTFAVIVEGQRDRVKMLHADIIKILPENLRITEILYSMEKSTRNKRIKKPQEYPPDSTQYLIALAREMERNMIRMDQKMNKILDLLQSGHKQTGNHETPDTDIGDDAASGFFNMFG